MTKTKANRNPSIWKKARFKYRLSFLNENTLEEVFTFRLSFVRGFLVVLGFAIILIGLTAVVIIKTPIRNYLPGYLEAEVRYDMVNNALAVDSLGEVLRVQSQYLNNIQSIMRGDLPEPIAQTDTTLTDYVPHLEKSEETIAFIEHYEEEERYNLNSLTSASSLPENLIFYRPARGLVSARFNLQEKHYGIDISTRPKESVLATMKGTVVFVGFDANAGYVIQMQHPNGFVSLYKHNAAILKKEGETVNAGEAIAIAGNTGNLSTGAHLHFELWYEGNPINPEDYILFQ